MLRSIIGWEILVGETYENTMSRMKKKMIYANTLYHVESWDTRILKMQINYMLHLSTLDHFHPARILLDQNPMKIRDSSQISYPYRSVGRPKIKWNHFLVKFCRDQFNMTMMDWLDHITMFPMPREYLMNAFSTFILN